MKDLLADTRPKRIIGRGRTRYNFLNLGILLGSAVFAALTWSNAVGRSVAALILLTVACLAGLGGGGFLLGAWMDRRAKTELRLLPVTPARTVDWVNIAVLIATILLVVIGVVGAVVAHRDATHPPSSGLPYHRGGAFGGASTSTLVAANTSMYPVTQRQGTRPWIGDRSGHRS